jgi:ribosomal protein S28E/S33
MDPVEETNLPRYVIFRGKKVRVLGYTKGSGSVPSLLRILEADDTQRSVRRSDITFIK